MLLLGLCRPGRPHNPPTPPSSYVHGNVHWRWLAVDVSKKQSASIFKVKSSVFWTAWAKRYPETMLFTSGHAATYQTWIRKFKHFFIKWINTTISLCTIYMYIRTTEYAANNYKKKKIGSGGIRTHASEETGALNQRLRPLGHATTYTNSLPTHVVIRTVASLYDTRHWDWYFCKTSLHALEMSKNYADWHQRYSMVFYLAMNLTLST